MAGYFVKRPEGPVGPGNEDFTALAEEFPRIAWLLAGRDKSHEAGGMPPFSLILFFDGGRLKFCFSSKQAREVAFGTVERPNVVLASIEASLADEKIEWKIPRR